MSNQADRSIFRAIASRATRPPGDRHPGTASAPGPGEAAGSGGHRASRMVYGRRCGHRLRSGQARLLADLLPALRIPDRPRSIDAASLFDFAPRAIWLEIGFGGAEHLVWQAVRNPDVGFIGVEPFVNGVAKLLAAIERQGLANVRVHDDDACGLLDRLRPASLERIFILFPDPWPKARHHKRRIVNPATVAALARVLASGGSLRIASDVADYQRWILEHLRRAEAFEWLAERARDWRRRPADWPPTRYEEKALAAGRRPAYLEYRRR